MIGSRLITYFKSLERKEVLEFGRYLRSSFHNRDPHIVRMYDYIKKYYPDLDSKKLAKEIAFRKIFPGEKYQQRKINDVMSDLSKKIESYLIYVETKEDGLNRTNLLLKALKKRKLNFDFFRVSKDTLSYLERSPERNMAYYQSKLKLNHEMNFHPAEKDYLRKGKNKAGLMDVLFDDLDKFYVLAKLRYYYEFLLKQGKGDLSNVTLIPELMEMSSTFSFVANPLFRIYRLSIEQFQEPTDENYRVLKNLIFKNRHLGNIEEQLAIMDLLIHHTSQSVRKGRKEYIPEVFDLYKFRIRENMLIEDGYFLEAHFLNIVNLGSTLKEYEFVENFIRDYKKHLKNQEIVVPVCEAKLYFDSKRYKKAITAVMQVQTDNPQLVTMIRVMEIKCNYELDDIETTYRLCEAYSSYLKRNAKIVWQVKESNQNFIDFVQYFLNPVKRPTKEKLLNMLEERKNVADSSWITEKISNLKR